MDRMDDMDPRKRRPAEAPVETDGTDWDEWDRQIEADILAGKWDAMAQRALEDHRLGKSTEL